jgi:NAD-dependent deacetylase
MLLLFHDASPFIPANTSSGRTPYFRCLARPHGHPPKVTTISTFWSILASLWPFLALVQTGQRFSQNSGLNRGMGVRSLKVRRLSYHPRGFAMTDSELIHQVASHLRAAKSIAVLTGAGISAESGIPTFRDAMTGLWAQCDPADLATPEAFSRDPEMVSRWYDERRCNVARCQPNPGHRALARLQEIATAQGKTFTLITQNVDRLHQAAGSTGVIELHGTLWVWRCMGCRKEVEDRGPAFASYPPRCACGGPRRPGVVWFGEDLPEDALAESRRAVDACEFFMTIGTSSMVYPAAGLIEQAVHEGKEVLEVNPSITPFSGHVTWSIRGKSGEVLPLIVAESETQP